MVVEIGLVWIFLTPTVTVAKKFTGGSQGAILPTRVYEPIERPKMQQVEVRPFDATLWDDLVTVLGPGGGSDGCWCMSWRSKDEVVGEEAKNALADLVAEGKVRGVLAYVDGEPAAWSTFGPRSDFYHAAHHPDFSRFSPDCFAVPCFFVRESFRGQGLTKQLLRKTIELARSSGASIIEGYPVKDDASEDARADWAFTGPPKVFEALGFEPAGACRYELQCVRRNTADPSETG